MFMLHGRWLHNSSLVPGPAPRTSAMSPRSLVSTLVLPGLDTGLYTCVAINTAGVAAARVQVTASSLSTVTWQVCTDCTVLYSTVLHYCTVGVAPHPARLLLRVLHLRRRHLLRHIQVCETTLQFETSSYCFKILNFFQETKKCWQA